MSLSGLLSGGDDEDDTVGRNVLECPVSKASHSRFMRSAFEATGIFVSKKVTHVPHTSSAKMADLAGVPESQIRRTGQWNTDTMSNAYLDSLPREFMRVMAGFETDAGYFLARATEEPCEELKRLVFESSLIGRLVPALQQELVNIKQTLLSGMSSINERQQGIDEAQQFFDDVMNGRQQLSLSVRLNAANASTGVVESAPAQISSPVTVPAEAQAVPGDAHMVAETNDPSPSMPSTTVAFSLPYNEEGVPVYRMSREVMTAADLWEEWMVGRGGFWSVEELGSKWGSKWRGKDRKWINIRKKVVDAVKDLITDLGLSAESAIAAVQNMMNTRYWSLGRLGTEIQKGNYPSPEAKRRRLTDA